VLQAITPPPGFQSLLWPGRVQDSTSTQSWPWVAPFAPSPFFSSVSSVWFYFCLKFIVFMNLRPTEPPGCVDRAPETFRGQEDRSLGSVMALGVLESGAHGGS
jgi:hypothetical protein